MSPEDRAELGPAGRTAPELQAESDRKGEMALQKQICQYLLLRESNGDLVFCYQTPTRKATGRVGTSDFVFCYRGRFCAAEAKVGSGQCTPEQAAFLEYTRAAGGVAAVVRSLDDVIALLRSVESDANNSPRQTADE